ncbi:adenylosuccinate synthase [Halobacteriales archaeon SW_7_68_16]|nr:MAG: adenylosuccinate synthase [Halobacteriales archaeon SW_7_68_16]
MTLTIVGTQMGDEGKGGFVDVFGEPADVVVRYQGGDNAGHTVVVDGDRFELSLVPSGAVRGKTGVLGDGCVVNLETLFDELDVLGERGLTPDVYIARRAHVVMPYHRVLDGIEEDAKGDDLAAGTTGRGIGPAYEDKAGRRGVRVGDLLDPDAVGRRLGYVVERKRDLLRGVYDRDPDDEAFDGAFDYDALYDRCRDHGRRLAENDLTVDCGPYLANRRAAGDAVLFEGAQGTGIGLDHGIYPYVTSSNPTAGGAATGTGLGPTDIDAVIGVMKAYLSRVGTGPLPTELTGDRAERIREDGGEFGTVTGRPRRIGWLDLPMVRHAARVNGLTGLAASHVDTLAGHDEVRVAEAYERDGERIETMPATTELWADCEPQYRTFDGWAATDWDSVAETGYDALPTNARRYLEFVAEAVDLPIVAVGVGPDRSATIVREHPLAD